jgi:hypothetical protein
MGRLHTIGKIIITVYGNDHLPQHFHAVHPDFEAQIEIDTFAILRGSLPPAARKQVFAWASENVAKIKTEWNRINPRFPDEVRSKLRRATWRTNCRESKPSR